MSPKDFIQSAWQWCPTNDSVVKRFQGISVSCEIHPNKKDLYWIRSIRQVSHRKMTFIFLYYLNFYNSWESKKIHIIHVPKGKETSLPDNALCISSSFHFLGLPVSASSVCLLSFLSVLMPLLLKGSEIVLLLNFKRGFMDKLKLS